MKVRYLQRAVYEIDRSLGYVKQRSPGGAAKIEARMMTILELLKLQPHTGTKTRVLGVRRVFLTPYPYLMDYNVRADEIVVQRFRHTSRRPIG